MSDREVYNRWIASENVYIAKIVKSNSGSMNVCLEFTMNLLPAEQVMELKAVLVYVNEFNKSKVIYGLNPFSEQFCPSKDKENRSQNYYFNFKFRFPSLDLIVQQTGEPLNENSKFIVLFEITSMANPDKRIMFQSNPLVFKKNQD